MSQENDLTLEKLKIDDRLREVEKQMATITATIVSEKGNLTNAINEITTELKHFRYVVIEGNGKPAYATRIDRLEQIEVNKKYHFSAIWSAIIALIGKLFYDWFTGNK